MSGTSPKVPLFRPEAVKSRIGEPFGAVVIPDSRLLEVLSIAAVVLVASMGALVTFGHHTRHVTAHGWLEPLPAAAQVLSRREGVVSLLIATEGQHVSKGDNLLVISSARASSRDHDVDGEVIRHLQRERESLATQLEVEQQLAQARTERLQEQIAAGEAEAARLEDVILVSRQRVDLAHLEWKRSSGLVERGLLPRSVGDKAHDLLLAAKLALKSAEMQLADSFSKQRDRKTTLRELPLELLRRQSELREQISQAERRISEADIQRDALVNAPISGYVTGVSVAVGDSVALGSALLSIVPDDAVLQAKLLVPSRAAGFVEIGRPVSLRFDAFPSEKFGRYPGQIEEMSRTPTTQHEGAGRAGSTEPVYLVTVELDRQVVEAYGKEWPLRPGFTLSAEIPGDRRRIAEWILEPLIAAKPAAGSAGAGS
ncbi:HlyD family secretion protein [Sinimarinibacterium flocculans]|uniref:HlyD family secretion protein n=1 Tax=Sinimarinibacterium flocculans TaxID=985250 RepID=UPI003513A097